MLEYKNGESGSILKYFEYFEENCPVTKEGYGQNCMVPLPALMSLCECMVSKDSGWGGAIYVIYGLPVG